MRIFLFSLNNVTHLINGIAVGGNAVGPSGTGKAGLGMEIIPDAGRVQISVGVNLGPTQEPSVDGAGAGRQGLEAEIAVLGPEHRGLVVNAQVGDAGGHLLGVALEQGGLEDRMGIGRVGVLGQGAADKGQARTDDVGLSVLDLP